MPEPPEPEVAEPEPEPEDENKIPDRLHLGEKRFEQFVSDLKDGPPKLHALGDEVMGLALPLHRVLASVNDLEVAIGELDSDIMSTAYEQQSLDEQIAELTPEQARVRKATAGCEKAAEQLDKDYAADMDSIAFLGNEIKALEAKVGLGAGWTAAQLSKKRALEREIEELEVDKERRQQELDQVRRETAAGREQSERMLAQIGANEVALSEVKAGVARYKAEAEEILAQKRGKQEEMKEQYDEHQRLMELNPELGAQVEKGVTEINDMHHANAELMRRIDLTAKQLDASASATEVKQREIDEARMRTRHRREEIEETKAATAVIVAEASAVRKQARKISKLAAKAETKTAEAEAERVKAEAEKDELKLKREKVDVEVSSLKRSSQQLSRERDALSQQCALLTKQEKEKTDAVSAVKKLLDILHVQERGLVLEVSSMAASVKAQRDEVARLEETIKAAAEVGEATEHRVEVLARQYASVDGKVAELLALEQATLAEIKAAETQNAGVVEERRRARALLNDKTEELRALRVSFASAGASLEEHKAELTRNTKQRLRVHFDQYLIDKEVAGASTKVARIAKFAASSVGLSAAQAKEVDRLRALAEAAEKQIKGAERDTALTLQEAEKLANQLEKTNQEIEAVLTTIKTRSRLLDMGKRAYEKVVSQRAGLWREMAAQKAKLKQLSPVAGGGEGGNTVASTSAASGAGDGSGGPGGAGHPFGSEHAKGGTLVAQALEREAPLEALSTDALKQRIISLEKDIQEEKGRTVALEEEMKRPLNVHRWLALETTDPLKMDAVKRVRSLTKQLVDAQETLSRMDAKIDKKKALCAKVQKALVRSGQAVVAPALTAGDGDSVTLLSEEGGGSTLAERLASFGKMLKERQGRLDALEAELDMYQQQVAVEGEEVAALEQGMQKLKLAWFADCRHRRDSQRQANEEAFDASMGPAQTSLLASGSLSPDLPSLSAGGVEVGQKVTIPVPAITAGAPPSAK